MSQHDQTTTMVMTTMTMTTAAQLRRDTGIITTTMARHPRVTAVVSLPASR